MADIVLSAQLVINNAQFISGQQSEKLHVAPLRNALLMFCPAILISLTTHDDVIDRDENKLDSVTDETHDDETHGASNSNFLELFGVRLGASLHKASRILSKLHTFLDTPTERICLIREKSWKFRRHVERDTGE